MQMIDPKATTNLLYVSELAFKQMQGIPTIDAVRVVRCQDCKHYQQEQSCKGGVHRFCKLHKGLVIVDVDTFCSYGERKGK